MIKASSNHLKTLVRQLTILGVTYTPATLDQVTFDTIINSAFVQGRKYSQQMREGNREKKRTVKKVIWGRAIKVM